jgi:hypothetical protein
MSKASPVTKLPVAVPPMVNCSITPKLACGVTTTSLVTKSLPTQACARSLTASLLWLSMVTLAGPPPCSVYPPTRKSTFICSPAENPDRQILGIRRPRLPTSAFLNQGIGILPNANEAR